MSSKRIVVAVLLAGFAGLCLAATGGAVAQDGEPGSPIAFHGEAEYGDGTPLSEGTVIVAAVDGDEVDRVTVDGSGVYAEDGPDASKLETHTNAGDQVTFHVGSMNGPQAAETHQIEEPGVYEQDLTFDADEVPTEITLELDGETDALALESGDEVDAEVTAVFADGSRDTITTAADLTSSNADAVDVDGSTVVAETVGDATISADYAGLQDSVDVDVAEDPADDGGSSPGGGAPPASGGGAPPASGGGDAPPTGGGDAGEEPIAEVTVPIEDAEPDAPGISVDFENTTLEEIVFSNASASGEVTVAEFDDVPADRPALPAGFLLVSIFEITVPDAQRGESATLRMTVSQERLDELGIDEPNLATFRLPDGADGWEELDAEVAETDAGIAVEVETPGFSTFAVAHQREQTPTPTATEVGTETATEAGTESPTEAGTATPTATDADDGPGVDDGLDPLTIGAIVLIALAITAGIVYYFSRRE